MANAWFETYLTEYIIVSHSVISYEISCGRSQWVNYQINI